MAAARLLDPSAGARLDRRMHETFGPERILFCIGWNPVKLEVS